MQVAKSCCSVERERMCIILSSRIIIRVIRYVYGQGETSVRGGGRGYNLAKAEVASMLTLMSSLLS